MDVESVRHCKISGTGQLRRTSMMPRIQIIPNALLRAGITQFLLERLNSKFRSLLTTTKNALSYFTPSNSKIEQSNASGSFTVRDLTGRKSKPPFADVIQDINNRRSESLLRTWREKSNGNHDTKV